MKNALQTIIVAALTAVTMLGIGPTPIANAEFYNFGTLDVKPIHTDEATNQDWFVEYLAPGQQKQQAIQISNFAPEAKELSIYVADTATNEGKTFMKIPTTSPTGCTFQFKKSHFSQVKVAS